LLYYYSLGGDTATDQPGTQFLISDIGGCLNVAISGRPIGLMTEIFWCDDAGRRVNSSWLVLVCPNLAVIRPLVTKFAFL